LSPKAYTHSQTHTETSSNYIFIYISALAKPYKLYTAHEATEPQKDFARARKHLINSHSQTQGLRKGSEKGNF